MPRARIALDLPGSYWLGGLSSEFPATTINVVSAVEDGDCVLHLDVRGESEDGLLAEMRRTAGVSDVEALCQYDGGRTALARTEHDPMVAAARDSLTPLRFPLQVRDGTAVLRVVAFPGQLATLRDNLDAAGLSWSVERIEESVSTDPLLTPRQRRVLRTAVESGYYDMPRECSLTDLADRLGIAKSTCSETLHRAESAVLKRFVRDQEAVTHPLTFYALDESPSRRRLSSV